MAPRHVSLHSSLLAHLYYSLGIRGAQLLPVSLLHFPRPQREATYMKLIHGSALKKYYGCGLYYSLQYGRGNVYNTMIASLIQNGRKHSLHTWAKDISMSRK